MKQFYEEIRMNDWKWTRLAVADADTKLSESDPFLYEAQKRVAVIKEQRESM